MAQSGAVCWEKGRNSTTDCVQQVSCRGARPHSAPIAVSGIPAKDTPGNRGPAVGGKPDWLGEQPP